MSNFCSVGESGHSYIFFYVELLWSVQESQSKPRVLTFDKYGYKHLTTNAKSWPKGGTAMLDSPNDIANEVGKRGKETSVAFRF